MLQNCYSRSCETSRRRPGLPKGICLFTFPTWEKSRNRRGDEWLLCEGKHHIQSHHCIKECVLCIFIQVSCVCVFLCVLPKQPHVNSEPGQKHGPVVRNIILMPKQNFHPVLSSVNVRCSIHSYSDPALAICQPPQNLVKIGLNLCLISPLRTPNHWCNYLIRMVWVCSGIFTHNIL